MTLTLERPVGAPADVIELEYCSALRQTTADKLRTNGSLTVDDVMLHLVSRHGVRASEGQVKQDIFIELSGCQEYQIRITEDGTSGGFLSSITSSLKRAEDQGNEVPKFIEKVTPLDLVQQVALLLIPELLAIKQGHRSSSDTSKFEEEPDAVTSSPGDVVDSVLLLILEEAGLEWGTELTVDALRRMLGVFGEDSWSDEVLKQMIAQASTGSELPILDGYTFLRALTADVEDVYDLKWMNQATSIYSDANSTKVNGKEFERLANHNKEEQPATEKIEHLGKYDNEAAELTRFFTAPGIDYTADTYASFNWAILAWIVLASAFFAYMFDSVTAERQGFDCDSMNIFACKLLTALLFWLVIFFELMAVGFTFIFLVTLGNSVYSLRGRRWVDVIFTLVSIVVICLVAIVSYKVEVENFFFSTVKVFEKEELYVITLLLGVILLAIQLMHLIRISVPAGFFTGIVQGLSSNAEKLEMRTKQACSYKTRRMLEQAMACHKLNKSSEAQKSMKVRKSFNAEKIANLNINSNVSTAMENFHKMVGKSESIGGAFWLLRNCFGKDQHLACEEGIWLFPRLWWCNLTQWCIAGAILYFYSFIIAYLKIEYADEPIIEGLSLGGAIAVVTTGMFFAVTACIWTALCYIPSSVTTFLRFRAGIIASLRDPNFKKYRNSPDSSSFIFGVTIWGAVFSAALTFVVVGGVTFLVAWDITRPIVVEVLANFCALFATVVLKIVILLILRRQWYGGLYRRRPLAANIMNAILECWHLGLSTGYITSRAIKLTMSGIFYIGRIDTPFLAEDASILGINLDTYPDYFRKDIVLHEAHRHPYMECWAFLYLLKLRYGSRFGRQGGATWRILFTLALMPWLRKYRVQPERTASDGLRNSTQINSEAFGELYFQKGKLDQAMEDLMEERKRCNRLEVLNRKLVEENVLLRQGSRGGSSSQRLANKDNLAYANSITARSSAPDGSHVCLICRRKFPTFDKLLRHEQLSSLHMENVEKQRNNATDGKL